MSMDLDWSAEIERERNERVEDLSAEYGSEWEERYRPGSFGCHELLDRTCLLADQLETAVLSHPSCLRNREWYALARKAVDSLRELYQLVGAEHV
jgi:hypothetical protein